MTAERIDLPPPEPQDAAPPGEFRIDLRLIAEMVAPASRMLDVGCGNGTLLCHLVRERGVDGRGVELSHDGMHKCVSSGLAVIQGDADTDLKDHPSASFDYVILSQTLQAMRNPKNAPGHLVRIGRRAVVSFPNSGYRRIRLSLLTGGRMPVTRCLHQNWWATPNSHLCTIADFADLCRETGIEIERAATLNGKGRVTSRSAAGGSANLLGEQGVFLLRRGEGP